MTEEGELVFDVETQKSFNEIGSRSNFGDLGISVVGVYSYRRDSYMTFGTDEMDQCETLFRGASRIIGFNIKHFDYPVLQPHMKSLMLKNLPTLDMMEELAKTLGFRPRLNDLAKATLGVSKSGHGLDAIRWFKEGKMEKIKEYCLDDVRITKELFEFGARQGHIKIERGITRIIQQFPVTWKKLEAQPVTQHSLFATPILE
jgi:DEAD/DEAH box helicase domain-containing protein